MIPRLMFLTMKAIKRLPLNLKTFLNILGVNRLKYIMEDPYWANCAIKTYFAHLHPPKYLSVTNCTLSNLRSYLLGQRV